MDYLCYLCLVFAMLSRLFVAAREMTDLLPIVCDVYCDFVTFLFGILGQVWYLIILIPDPCCLSYFKIYNYVNVCVPETPSYAHHSSQRIVASTESEIRNKFKISVHLIVPVVHDSVL